MISRPIIAVAIILVVMLCGCMGTGDNPPVIPANPASQDLATTGQQEITNSESGHSLWGFYYVKIDPDRLESEIIPVRQTAMHVNVLKFLEQNPCTNCFKIAGISAGPSGTFNIDISIKHPFATPLLTGFDVRGIAMFNGSKVFPVSGLTMSDSALGDGELMNADGYTTLYNPSTTDHAPLEGYLKGKYASATAPNAALNGFKRFISDDPANTRNAFYAGDTIKVTYNVKIPSPVIFGYAIDANWAQPVNKPVKDPMTDFGPEANCPEPWKIEIADLGPGLSESGGNTILSINVYDRGGKTTHEAPVVECPELFSDSIAGVFKSDGADFSSWQVTITNSELAVTGDYRCLVSVVDNENDPVAKPWLDLTAYHIFPIHVSEFQNELPVALAKAEPNPGLAGDPVNFTDDGSYDPDGGTLTKFEWDWENDGTFDEEGSDIEHTWNSPGTFYVQFRVTDDEGTSDTLDTPLEIVITPLNEFPIALAKADPNPQAVGEPVNFSDDGSYDPDGGLIAKYEWDWENDGTFDEEGGNIEHTWNTSGTYYVQFRVTDDEGSSDTLDTPLEIIINDKPPIALAKAEPNPQFVGESVNFTDDGSYDPDGGLIVKYEWDWDNDGTFDEEGDNVNHTWNDPGTFEVQFRVTDDEGSSDTLDTPLEIIINDKPPIALAKAEPNPQSAGDPVNFSDDGSYDPDGGSIVKYEWDWENDGTFDEEGVNVNHTWADPGTYYVQFRVTDDEGSSDTLDAPLEINILFVDKIPIALAKAEPNQQTICLNTEFSDDGSYDPDGGLIVEYAWDFDYDGVTFDEEAIGAAVNHSYSIPGDYEVMLRVKDDEGTYGYLAAPLAVTANNELPTAVVDYQYSTWTNEPVIFDGSDSHDNDCGNESITKWEWDWDNDGIYDEEGDNTEHSWSEPGTYYIQLRVTDDEGTTDTLDEPMDIIVESLYPKAKATASPNPQVVGQPVNFSDNGSYDPDGTIAKYEWDWESDGIYDEEGANTSHTWDSPGVYYVQFRVTDNDGFTGKLVEPLAIVITLDHGSLTMAKRAGGAMEDQGKGITALSDNTTVLTGYFADTATFGEGEPNQTQLVSSGDDDIFIASYSHPYSVLAWAKKVGGSGYDQGHGVTTLSDDSTVVTGIFSGTVTFGKDEANQTELVSAGGSDIFVARYYPNGNLAWAKRAGGNGSDSGNSITTVSSDKTVVTGYFFGIATFGQGEVNQTQLVTGGNWDIFVACYNLDGSLAWAKRAGGTGQWEEGLSITSIGIGTVVTGYFRETATFGPGELHQTQLIPGGAETCFIARYNPDGSLEWAKRAGGTLTVIGHGITAVGTSVVVAGEFYQQATFAPGEYNQTVIDSEGYIDAFIAKYNSSGNLIWVKNAGGSMDDGGYGVTTLSDNSTVVTGWFCATGKFGPGEPNQIELTSNGAPADIFVARYAEDGSIEWAKRAGGPGWDYGFNLVTLSNDSSVVTGKFLNTAIFGPGEQYETQLDSAGDDDIFIAWYAP